MGWWNSFAGVWKFTAVLEKFSAVATWGWTSVRRDCVTNASPAAAHTRNKWGNQGLKHFEVGSWLFDFGWQILNCIWTGGSLVMLPSVDLLEIIDYIVRHLAGCSSARCVQRILLEQRTLNRRILTLYVIQTCCKINVMMLFTCLTDDAVTHTVWPSSYYEAAHTFEMNDLFLCKTQCWFWCVHLCMCVLYILYIVWAIVIMLLDLTYNTNYFCHCLYNGVAIIIIIRYCL